MADNIPIIEIPKKNFSPILISIFCIGIIIFIIYTQCEVSNIKLKPKDASLVLIFLALIAYINNYQILFILLLGLFIFIYFSPDDYINKLISPFLKNKLPKSIIKKPKKVLIEEPVETTESPEQTFDNEITDVTLDTDIEIDDDIDTDIENVPEGDSDIEIEEPQNTNGDVYQSVKKKIN